jgi:hypothetical protein
VGEDPAAAGQDGVDQCLGRRQFGVPADHRDLVAFEAPELRPGRAGTPDGHGFDPRRLALELEYPGVVPVEERGDQAADGGTDQHRTRPGGGLEAGGRVQRVAEDLLVAGGVLSMPTRAWSGSTPQAVATSWP